MDDYGEEWEVFHGTFDGAVTYAKLADGAKFAGNNIIINGNMDVAQRGTSFASPVNNAYTIDRFQWNFSGAGAVTITQDSASVPDGSEFALKVAVTTADTSLAAGDLYGLQYRVEGKDVAAVKFGLSTAEQITLSFWVRSTVTGTYHVAFRNSASNRSYPASYTINAADTWEFKTITLTGDITGTWNDSENTVGLFLFFTLAAGSTVQGTANEWQAGNVNSASGAANAMSSTSNTFHITQVQLVVGAEAPRFQQRPIGEEFALCQRYANNHNLATDGAATGMCVLTTAARCVLPLSTRMMKAPVVTYSSGASGYTALNAGGANLTSTSITTSSADTTSLTFQLTVASGLVQGNATLITGGSMLLDAEL